MDSTLRLKARPPVEDEVENWDDEDFLIDGDDLGFPSLSNSANISNNRRDSQSSFRSDFESVHGEEEKQVHLPDTDEKSTLDAIAAAAKAGIPLPKNVPPSALMGGTIKRLGGRKIRRIIQEDWVEDLEFPDAGQVLQIKKRDGNQFPEVLRQVSNSAQPSPSRPPKDFNMIHTDSKERESTPSSSFIDLERFRDADDDDDFFGDGGATIKVSKRREIPKPLSLITPPTPQKLAGGIVGGDDDFEHDFELPEDGKLRLSAKRDVPPKTPTLISLMEDLDWAEGSLGTRFGGTRRDAQSTRSSSVSAFSPSIASSILESEDETFDGLIIPNGPLDFGERLKRRRQSRSPARAPAEPIKEEPAKEEPVRQKPAIKEEKEEDNEDFLHGLDIGDGEVFDSRKLTLNRNIQVKATRPASPSRPKASVALKFTNKPVTASRLPRPMGPMVSHERSHTQSSLEPVSESGGPIPRAQPRRSLSRMGGHSAHSSVTSLSSVTTPTTPSSTQTVTPSTPRRIELGQRASQVSLRTTEPTTTNAQLLRLKRSLPVMRNTQSPARPPPTRYERPPSRTEQSTRAPPTLRPKTPVERMRTTESATPRPALITNIGATKGVQVVGGMVFDPQNMCWLKLGPQARSERSDTLDGFNALDHDDDEDDVFKDIPDLEERTMASSDCGGGGGGGGGARVSDVNHEWPVGEEFDVGPEFVRRQREEEERWRKKCQLWVTSQVDRGDAWKWAIRDIVSQSLAD